ncbi:Transcription initiation factor IIB-2 [Glycine max]|nr:Transcription initiation factor IIB-2 [Glycine max]
MIADEEYCSDCKSYTPLVYDHNAGDTICSECGLVLESRSIEEEIPKLRLYGDKHEDDDDGGGDHEDEDEHQEQGFSVSDPFNTLLLTSGAGLSTLVTHPSLYDNNNSDMVKTRKNQRGIKNSNRDAKRKLKTDCDLVAALLTMEQMANNLGLAWSIKNHAKELYKKAEDRRRDFQRTVKEIQSVSGGAKEKNKHIYKAIGVFKKHFQVGRNYDKTQVLDIGERLCTHLGLDNHVIKAVREVLQKALEFIERSRPSSVLAATIYMVDQLSSDNMMHFRDIKEVAKACIVKEYTVKKAYRDLHALAFVLIPSWYANAEDIKRLCII